MQAFLCGNLNPVIYYRACPYRLLSPEKNFKSLILLFVNNKLIFNRYEIENYRICTKYKKQTVCNQQLLDCCSSCSSVAKLNDSAKVNNFHKPHMCLSLSRYGYKSIVNLVI